MDSPSSSVGLGLPDSDREAARESLRRSLRGLKTLHSMQLELIRDVERCCDQLLEDTHPTTGTPHSISESGSR